MGEVQEYLMLNQFEIGISLRIRVVSVICKLNVIRGILSIVVF